MVDEQSWAGWGQDAGSASAGELRLVLSFLSSAPSL